MVRKYTDAFSSFFILDVATISQMDDKLFSATYILCSKKFCNKKIEGENEIRTETKVYLPYSLELGFLLNVQPSLIN